jgi:hypothetical protein
MLGPTPAGGVAIAERATQQPLLRARKQGRARGVDSGAIVAHPNVKRILLTMRALHPHRARRIKCVDDCCLLVADHTHFLIDANSQCFAHAFVSGVRCADRALAILHERPAHSIHPTSRCRGAQ